MQTELREAGFTKAADVLEQAKLRTARIARAYEHYRYVPEDRISAYNSELINKTYKVTGFTVTYSCLQFTPVEDYPHVPPADVVEAVSTAKATGIFDSFTVCAVSQRTVVPDPIIFGRITGCSDYFYIAQWGDDIKLSDLISDTEG